jgi:hypothetical protein
MKRQILILALLAIARPAGASAEHGDEYGSQYYAGDMSTKQEMSTKKAKCKKQRHTFFVIAPVIGVGGSFEHSLGSPLSLSWRTGADMEVEVGKYISGWGTFRTMFGDIDYFSNTSGAKVNVSEREYDIGMGGAVHPFGGKEWPFDLALKAGSKFFILDNDKFTTWGGGISLGGGMRIDILRFLYLTADASWTFNAFHPANDSDLGSLNRLGGPKSLTTYSAGVGFRAGPHASLILGFEGDALELKATMRYDNSGTMAFVLKL